MSVQGLPSVERLVGLGIAAFWLASDWPVHDVAKGFMYSVGIGASTWFSASSSRRCSYASRRCSYAFLAGRPRAVP